jgi:hypothetical protein
MPTHRPKRSARIDRGSGRKNRGRLDRRSSARWRSGWPSSKSESSIRIPVPASSQPGVGVHVVWRASFRWRRRNGWSVRARPPNRNSRSNPGGVAGGGGAAAEVSRPARKPRRRRSNPGQIDRRRRSGRPERAARSGRVPAPPNRVTSPAHRGASSPAGDAAAVGAEAAVLGRRGSRRRPNARLPRRWDFEATPPE